ncbi:HNH endonuclease signature motif containing protein [Jiangella alkaliphila]|uniref:HNH endonuclease n=1 Tax=Jiangella alkaliphila TaxID=419479 RepID=A0A1H2L8V0_9ACTN|nr:HNH endonuclease signature motif containing protein [Jiangella alkaliphila]SDU77460.1 HNH endonuclease [Jiangella alkaliphila]
MFEEATYTALSPGSGPAAADHVVWHPDRDEWVALTRCERPAGALPAGIERIPAGPRLAAVLARFDPSTADAYDLVEAAAAWARLAAWVAAGDARSLAELASRAVMRPAETGHRSLNPVTNTAMDVAGRCQVTARQAEHQVGHSLQLVEDFPDTHAALAAGLIDLRRARVITDELGGQEPAVRARVEAAVLPKAPTMDAVALRKLIKRLLQELAPVEAADRNRRARDSRYVAITPASDGMAFLEALMPAEDLAALNTALNVAAADAKRADAAAGLPARTKDHRRADTLADLGWAALAACADGTISTAAGHAPHSVPARDAGQASGTASRGTGRGSSAATDRTGDLAGHPTDAGTDRTDGPAGHAANHAPAAGPTHDARRASGTGRASSSATARTGIDLTDAQAHSHGQGATDVAGGQPRRPDASATAALPPSSMTARRAGATPPTSGATPGSTGTTPSTSGATPDSAGTTPPTAGTTPGSAGTTAPTSGTAPRTSGTTPGGAGTTPRRRPVAVQVTIPFTALVGLDDQPGELDGYGPIPAHVARELAAGGVWTWLRTDPATGQLLDRGTSRYRPTTALARFITARDRTCGAPGCHRPAREADIDHAVPFAAGGPTSAANLQVLCTTHHLLKHRGGWRVAREPDGTTRWRSPTGHRYDRPPERFDTS